MTTHEERITALEKDATAMKRDIIYKLDDTNHYATMLRALMEGQKQDIKTINGKVDVMGLRLDGIDMRLARVEEQQNIQGQDIREMKRQLSALDEKFEQMLQMLTNLSTKTNE